MQHVTLKTPDNFSLDAQFGEGTNGKGIIFIHGIANDIQREEPLVKAAQELNALGFSTLLFDIRAHGKSSGNSIEDFTLTSLLTDIDTAVQYVQDKGADTIYLAGASFGAGAACLYAETHKDTIKALLLENPVLDYESAFFHAKNAWGIQHFAKYNNLLEEQGYVPVGSNDYKLGPKLFDEMKQYHPFSSLEKFTHPVYILHGDRDHILPYEDSLEFFEKLQNPKKKFTLIPGADHGFHVEPFTTQAAEKIVDFFTSQN